jgi:hypothetical protein
MNVSPRAILTKGLEREYNIWSGLSGGFFLVPKVILEQIIARLVKWSNRKEIENPAKGFMNVFA